MKISDKLAPLNAALLSFDRRTIPANEKFAPALARQLEVQVRVIQRQFGESELADSTDLDIALEAIDHLTGPPPQRAEKLRAAVEDLIATRRKLLRGPRTKRGV